MDVPKYEHNVSEANTQFHNYSCLNRLSFPLPSLIRESVTFARNGKYNTYAKAWAFRFLLSFLSEFRCIFFLAALSGLVVV